MELHAPPKTGNVQLDNWLERLCEELMHVNAAAFSYVKSANQSDIPINSSTTVTWDTQIIDVGGCFASNTFTAPVAGNYFLTATLVLNNVDSVSTYYMMRIVTSGKTYQSTLDVTKFSGDLAYLTISLPIIAVMDKGDTATVEIFQASGTQQTDVSASGSLFSGVLLGR